MEPRRGGQNTGRAWNPEGVESLLTGTVKNNPEGVTEHNLSHLRRSFHIRNALCRDSTPSGFHALPVLSSPLRGFHSDKCG